MADERSYRRRSELVRAERRTAILAQRCSRAADANTFELWREYVRKSRDGNRGLTKADLTNAVCRELPSMTRAEAATIVETILRQLKTSLVRGRAVKIKNFGTFVVSRQAGRRGVDPVSGERIYIPPRRRLSFRASKRLLELVETGTASAE